MMLATNLEQEQFVCCQKNGIGAATPGIKSDPSLVNPDTLDGFTFVHAYAGAAAGLLNCSWWLTLSGAILWELVEPYLKHRLPGAFPDARQDTDANAILDIGVAMLGWGTASAIRRTAS